VNQLGLNFEGYDEPAKNGVYTDGEILKMPPGKSRGSAEIRLAFTAAGFLWASSAMMETQGYGSLPNVCDVKKGRVTPSRGEAIKKACDEIQRQCGTVKTKAAAAILAWVNELREAA